MPDTKPKLQSFDVYLDYNEFYNPAIYIIVDNEHVLYVKSNNPKVAREIPTTVVQFKNLLKGLSLDAEELYPALPDA